MQSWNPSANPFHRLILALEVFEKTWLRFHQSSFKLNELDSEIRVKQRMQLFDELNKAIREYAKRLDLKLLVGLPSFENELLAYYRTCHWTGDIDLLVLNSSNWLKTAMSLRNAVVSPGEYQPTAILWDADNLSKWQAQHAAWGAQDKKFEQQGLFISHGEDIRKSVLNFIAQNGHTIPRRIGDASEKLYLACTYEESAVEKLLNDLFSAIEETPSTDIGRPNDSKSARKNRKTGPSTDNATVLSNIKLYKDYQASGTTKKQFLENRGLPAKDISKIEAGRVASTRRNPA